MRRRYSAGLLLAAGLAGCQADLTTTPSESESLTSARAAEPAPNGTTAPPDNCLTCTFEPQLFSRSTGQPVIEVIEFPGNPDGAYTIEFDDLGSRGGQTNVELNGERIHVKAGVLRQEVVLDWENALHVRLTGKPGSRVAVRVFQEIASVTMTPQAAKSRLPATAPFEAVALDRNGVSIPRQTFTWHTSDSTIAAIDAASGLVGTVGPLVDMRAWNYKTVRPGAGDAEIIAHADGTDMRASGTWTVTGGFVYTTFQAPRALDDPHLINRPLPVPYSYDSTRLAGMIATCDEAYATTDWMPRQVPLPGEREFHLCYPQLEHETPTQQVVLGAVIEGFDSNVGLYGRYCGAGFPDGDWWWEKAWKRGYQPKDPIDAICMEHDRSEDLHDLDATGDPAQAACIVRYGIEAEQLHEDGVRIMPGSARWNHFWRMYPDMAEARAHWLEETPLLCNNLGDIYNKFLRDRGLERPGS